MATLTIIFNPFIFNNQAEGKQMINTNIAIGGQPGSAGNGDKVKVVQKGK